MAAGWEGLKAASLTALEGTIAGVVSFGDRTAAIFQGAYDAAVAIWGSLPGAIGDFAFQAANGLISGVEAMLNGVVTRINSFIETLNAALALLPEWATGEGGVRIGILDPVELGRIGNPFEGAATAAGAADTQIVWTLDGFVGPESVAADPVSGLLYVSNFGADPMSKDGDGTIARITADGKLDKAGWVTGLDAPKGMDVTGGKLYVADIDQLVEIDTATGQVTNRYPAEGAQFLNDVAAAPDGRVFISDTFGAAVYVLEAGKVSLFAQDAALLAGANGLLVSGGALLVADLGDLSGGFANIKPGPVVQIDLAGKAITPYGAEGPVGVLDGIEPDGQGGVYLTDNPQGNLLNLKPGGTAKVVANVGAGAADMEWLPDQGLVIIPITPANHVVAVKLN